MSAMEERVFSLDQKTSDPIITALDFSRFKDSKNEKIKDSKNEKTKKIPI